MAVVFGLCGFAEAVEVQAEGSRAIVEYDPGVCGSRVSGIQGLGCDRNLGDHEMDGMP